MLLFLGLADEGNVQLIKLLLHDGGRSAHHNVLRVLVHRERDDLADALLAGEEHDHAVNARRDACMRGSAVAEGVIHGGELLLDVLFAEADKLESLYHNFGVVVTHGAGAELNAVADEVVLVGGDGQRVYLAALRLQQHIKAAGGHGERVMAKLKLAGLLADLVHREIDDPAELVALLVHMAGNRRAEHLAHDACGLLRFALRACRDADKAAGLEVQLLNDSVLTVGEELRHAACKLAVLIDLEPVGLAACLHLDVGAELVDMLTGQVAVGDDDGLDGVALGKRRELYAADKLGDVLDDEVDTQVGLVGAVLLHGLKIGDAFEGRGGCDVILAVLGEDRRQHVLEDGKNVVLAGEGHLHIELVELAGAAVTARVLIAEAGGNLEVAVKACGHKQLLELLRRLRQSIELAGVLSRGDKIVARALGGGCGEYRGGYLKEAVLGHRLTQGGDNVAAQNDILLDGGISQVEVAVFETRGLVGLAAAVYLKGQLVIAALAEDLYLFGDDLDVAGRLLGVLAGALADDALDGNSALLVDGVDNVHHFLGLNDDLSGAVEIADNDEREVIADLADVLHPADDLDFLAYVFEAQLVAGVCT